MSSSGASSVVAAVLWAALAVSTLVAWDLAATSGGWGDSSSYSPVPPGPSPSPSSDFAGSDEGMMPAVRGLQPLLCYGSRGDGGGSESPPEISQVLSHMGAMLVRDVDALGIGNQIPSISPESVGPAGEYLAPLGKNSFWGLSWAAGKLLGVVDKVLRSVSILWSDAEFEVRGVPVEAAGRLVLAQRPLASVSTICSWLGGDAEEPNRRMFSFLTRSLCSFGGPPVPGFSISRPCAGGSVLGIGGDCNCVETACTVMASPFRSPCLFVDGLDPASLRFSSKTRFAFEIIAKECKLPPAPSLYSPRCY
jgi:hypothetical protein